MRCWRSIEAEDEINDLHAAFRSDCHEEPGKKKMVSSFAPQNSANYRFAPIGRQDLRSIIRVNSESN